MNSNIAFANSIRDFHFFRFNSSICIVDQNDSIMALMLLYLSSSDFMSCGLGFDEVIDLADHVAFEATDDVSFGFSFSCSARDIGDGGFMKTHAGNHGAVDRRVELTVSAMVDPVFPAGHA